jgi:hypothetical protein
MRSLPPDEGRMIGGLPLGALVAGAIGGALGVGVAAVLLAMTGGLKSSTTTTVAVQESAVS